MQLHLIIGDDDYLIDETAKKSIGEGAGVECIDSINATNADLQLAELAKVEESVSTPPFLEPSKVTWWKHVGFLPGSKVSEIVKEALDKFAEKLVKMELPENQHFILSGPQLLKTSKFMKTLATAAEVVVFEGGKPWQKRKNAVVRAIDWAEERKLKFASGVAEKFISIVGCDSRSILSELDKLVVYLEPGATVITAEAVDDITSGGVQDEPEIWGVTDAVGERNAAKALAAMKKFELENGFAVMMSNQLEKLFRQLIEVKLGKASGMNPYTRQKLEDAAIKWKLPELRRARARFLALREQVVSGTRAGDILVVTETLRALRFRG